MDQSWRKSSYSTAENVNCVEYRTNGEVVHLRDTQHRRLAHLSVSTKEWRAFLAAVERF